MLFPVAVFLVCYSASLRVISQIEAKRAQSASNFSYLILPTYFVGVSADFTRRPEIPPGSVNTQNILFPLQ